MSFQQIIDSAKQYFPDLQIKYKDKSLFMKIISFLLFFNKNFMTSYTTTIGSTIYFPNESFVISNSTSATITLLHELVHISDAKKINKFLFGFLYLSPQILFVFALPILLISWKLSLLFVLFLLPIPSYFRMKFEKRAYMASLYALDKLSKKLKFNYNAEESKNHYLQQFFNSYYYFMWPFRNISEEFDIAVLQIKNGEHPFDDKIFDIIDDIISKS